MRKRTPKHTKLREVVCYICGKHYQNYYSPKELLTPRMCSRECKNEYFRRLKQKRSYITECKVCHKSFRTQFCENKKYCSRKCMGIGFKDRIISIDTRKRLSISKSGKNNPQYGKPRTLDERQRMAKAISGEKSPRWRGGLTEKAQIIRLSLSFKVWREEVYKRDKYTCQKCFLSRGKDFRLHPHHIKPFAKYPELRFDVANGITLCSKCHGEIHNIDFISRQKKYREYIGGKNEISTISNIM